MEERLTLDNVISQVTRDDRALSEDGSDEEEGEGSTSGVAASMGISLALVLWSVGGHFDFTTMFVNNGATKKPIYKE